jgi:hypothetical protein
MNDIPRPVNSLQEKNGVAYPGDALSFDDLVSGAANAAAKLDVNASNSGDPGTKKKDKEKAKLIYSDNEISPEEKMAGLSRYAFVPERKGDVVLGNAIQPTVTGIIQD